MNIKDSYLHGGTHVMKNIQFSIAASGTNQDKLVATITWAEEGAPTTELVIPISGATFGSLTKNTVFAAPNGSNGVPSFRTLVAADIPNISAKKITSDTLEADRLPLATNSAKGAIILGVAKTSDADSAITGKKYWVKMNTNGKLFVDIPWTDHTYTVNNATFSIKSKIGTNDAVTLSDFTANQSAADDFTLIQGSNITFTNDATNRTLTIAGTPNTTYKLTLNGTVKGTTGGTDLGTFYAIATSDTSTANQVWMRNSSNDGYGWRTLGSRAFDSTAYLPLTGGTLTGILTIKPTNASGILEGLVLYDNGSGSGEGCWIKWVSASNTTGVKLLGKPDTNILLFHNGTNWYTIYHSGNIPSNSKSTAGIVAKGVASRVYMTSSDGTPSWTEYDTTVTSGSGKLVTSGAVYTAIANNVAGAVQYQGTIDSEADMIALTSAGQGDFARVTTAFTFTDATGNSVTAHVGDVVYLTNNTPGTSSNWIVAHTEIDTDTWTAASTSAAGYIPKLVTGGANLGAASTDYVLAYINGTSTPVWRKLPANAYKNDNTTGIKLATVSGTKKTDSTLISISSGTGLNIAGGTNKFLIGDGTNYIEVGVAHGLTTKNLSINGTNYALYTSASSLPSIKAPTDFGTANQILATNANADGLTWVTKPTSNVTTSLYIGASNGTSTSALTSGNVHIILKEGSSYTRYNIIGTGRTAVTSDANGKITIDTPEYSIFGVATAEAGGTLGLVPAPGANLLGSANYYLRADASWATPPNDKVTLTKTTTSAAYEILFSETADNTTRTEGVRKTSTLTYNPSTKALSTGGAVNGLTLSPQTTGFKISGGSTTSKTLTVGADYTLAAACAKGVFDKSSATAVGSSGTNLVTERAVYYTLPTINGAHTYNSSSTFFAPTSAGTSGQVLVSNGSGAPGWVDTENYTTTTIGSASYSLKTSSWTAVSTALPTTSGTYALYIDDSTNGSYSGIFSIEGGAKEKLEEIPLHWATAATTTADSSRIYAAVKEGKLLLASNNSSATSYTLTIKYKRII